MRVAFRLRSALPILALFLVVLAGTGLAASRVVDEAASARDPSGEVEWCEADPALSVEAIAGGGCRLSPAGPADLVRGYSRRAFWLRIVLEHGGPVAVERWLRIGYAALRQVAFYEEHDGDFVLRGEAGLAASAPSRPLAVPDPVLPIVLAPGERKTFWIRVASETSIDLAPSLWRPDAYLDDLLGRTIAESLAIGGMLITAGFAFFLFLQERERIYLFFIGLWLSKGLFAAAYAVLTPKWIPVPVHALTALAAGSMIVCAALFACNFVGEPLRYRLHRRLLLVTAASTGGLALITGFVDFRAVVPLRLAALVSTSIGLAMFWRAWRRGSAAAGFTFWASAIPLLSHLVLAAVTYGAAPFSDRLLVVTTWSLLLTAPLALFGLTARREQLKRALTVARAENAARVDFLARMSHELRTPLDTILGTARLLSRPSGRGRLDEDLADITRSGRRLLRMIDDILDYARGLAGRSTITPEPVDWPSFLQGVARDARRLAARNGNHFALRIENESETAGWVALDPTRLRQVLDNLVRNAARHTRDGEISLTCRCEPAGENGRLRLRFAVADTGEGIDPGDLERIFKPFERGSSTVRGDGHDLGLGLSIARQLVERMGGRLTVESELGRGACFRFDVRTEPAAEAPPEDVEDPTASIAPFGSDRTILLVEDDLGSRATTARLLRAYGFEVVEVGSGREAIVISASPTSSVDLVLTDQMMSDGDGWSVLVAFAEKRPEIPVVLVSAAPPNRPPELPETIRFVACLMKPLDHAELADVLADRLDLRRERSSPPDPTPPAPSVSAVPATADLRPLLGLIETGQVSAIVEWADALESRRPDLRDFAAEVRTAARHLDFSALAVAARSAPADGRDG